MTISKKNAENIVLETTPKINALNTFSVPSKVDAIRRHNKIEKAAYYLAENKNFEGDSLEHWLQAEASIDGKFAVK